MKTWKKSCSMIFAVVLSLSFILMHSTIAFADTWAWSFVDGDSATTGINYNTAKNALYPRMVDFNGTGYVIWSEVFDTKSQIRVKKLVNGAWVTADNDTPLNKDASRDATTPHLAVFNNELYATWQEAASTSWWQLRVAKYNGTSWNLIDGNGDYGLNASNTNGRTPRLAAYNNKLYVFWEEAGGDGVNRLRAKVYAGGSTWNSADGGASLNKDNTKAAKGPEVAVYNGKLYVTWYENSSTVLQVRVKAYNGSSWSFVDGNAGTGLNVDVATAGSFPYMEVYDNNLYLAWAENSQIRVKKYNGTSWTLVDGGTQTTGLNQNTSQSGNVPRMVVFDDNLYVAWQEGAINNQIRVKQYDGTTWTSFDGNSAKGLNKITTNNAILAYPSVVNSSLYVTFLETSSSTSQVRVVNWGPSNAAPTATNVSFTGDLKQGSTLTGTYTYGDADGDPVGVTTYKWYTATDAAGTGKTVIAGAVNNTLTLTGAEANKFIIFEVTPVASTGTLTGTPVTFTGATAVVPNAAPTATNVSFTGDLKQGSTLTGTYTYGDADGDPVGVTTYKWYTATDAAGTGKTVIAGAVNNTLTLTSAEANKFIIFEVTPVASTGTPTGTPATFTSVTAVVPNAAPTASAVSFTGTLKEGNTLNGTYTYGDTDGDLEGVTTFKWYTATDAAGTGKTAIAGEVSKTLTLTSAQANKFIIFEVTPVASTGTPTGTPAIFTSATAVVPNAAPTASAVSFTGTLKEGNTLNGTYTYGDTDGDLEGVTTFKWYTATDVAGTAKSAIAGAVSKTLTLTSAQANKFIIFEVTPVASTGTLTGTPATFTSATAVVPNAAPTATNAKIDGVFMLTQTLTGSYTYTDADNDGESGTTFKWYTADDAAGSNKTVIAGETGITLTLKAAQFGKYIIFEVTPKAASGASVGTPIISKAGGPVTVLKGDANGDGIVSPADALLATRYAQGKITLTDEQKKALDMDDDGDVDAIDSQLILNVYLGKGV